MLWPSITCQITFCKQMRIRMTTTTTTTTTTTLTCIRPLDAPTEAEFFKRSSSHVVMGNSVWQISCVRMTTTTTLTPIRPLVVPTEVVNMTWPTLPPCMLVPNRSLLKTYLNFRTRTTTIILIVIRPLVTQTGGWEGEGKWSQLHSHREWGRQPTKTANPDWDNPSRYKITI